MKAVVVVDASEEYLCTPGATGALVAYTSVVAGKVVGSAVAAARVCVAFASSVAEVAALVA